MAMYERVMTKKGHQIFGEEKVQSRRQNPGYAYVQDSEEHHMDRCNAATMFTRFTNVATYLLTCVSNRQCSKILVYSIDGFTGPCSRTIARTP